MFNAKSTEIPQHEPEKLYRNIRFEAGIHKMAHDFGEEFQKIEKGDLNIHIWNPEVAKRMSEYHPEVVAIDSLDPFIPPISIDDRRFLWWALPARPRDLNPKGEIYVVCGDVSPGDISYFGRLGSNQEVIRKMSEYDLGNPISDQKIAKYVEEGNQEVSTLSKLGSLLSSTFLIYKAMTMNKFPDDKSKNEISRRDFLKLGGAAGVVLLLGRTNETIVSDARDLVGKKAVKANSEYEEGVILHIASLLRPRFQEENLINGRGALVTAKEEDSINVLHLPPTTPGSIVMGWGHAPEATRLMANRSARTSTIAKYAGDLVTILEETLQTLGYTQDQKFIAVNHLLDLIAETTIVKVSDPGGPSDQPDFMQKINGLFSEELYFLSPQVLKATQHLRPNPESGNRDNSSLT